MFYKKVNLKSKKEMIDFLTGHFRYNTMNSWNCSSSYANNLKIYHVIPRELRTRAYEIIEQGDIYEEINFLIEDFNIGNEYVYQAGFNGRSGGYLVLYLGGCNKKTIFKKEDFKKDNGYSGRVYADGYGWKSLKEAQQAGLVDKEIKQVFSTPGKGIDEDAGYLQDEDISFLSDRVKLVQEFDGLCDSIVRLTVSYCKQYKVVDEVVKVPKKIKVLQEV